MTFSLNTKIIYPDKENDIKSAIILLHGYGGDGNDISAFCIHNHNYNYNNNYNYPPTT